MVKVNVTNNESAEDNNDDSMEEMAPESEKLEQGKEDKKELPLDKMSKYELIEKIQEVKESADKNFDLYIHCQADIENMKKRFQKEKESLIKYSNESLIKQFLTVVDNLEKAVIHAKDEKTFSALKEGVEFTLKGLVDTLKKVGVEEIMASGELFDPNLHEAIFQEEDNTKKPGTIIKEIQKGYLLNKRLIRPSLVSVSKKKG